MRKVLFVLTGLLLLVPSAHARNYDIYQCGVGNITTCPTINASVADSVWGSTYVPKQGSFVRYADGLADTKGSQFAAVYNADRIFIGMFATSLVANSYCGLSDVYRGDAIEMFFDIDPPGTWGVDPYQPDMTDYYQMCVSTACESTEWAMAIGSRDWNWNPTMSIGGAVGAGIEFSVPFNQFDNIMANLFFTDFPPIPGVGLPPPHAGASAAVWGINPCRSDVPGGSGSSWSYTTAQPGGFHVPTAFGTLTFKGPVSVDSQASWGEVKASFAK